MSNENFKKYKQEILRLSKKKRGLLELFFSEKALILGSYMETRMRCGTASCHCHKDGGHPAMRISYWKQGKLKNKIVRIGDREWVAEASGNYKAHKHALREIIKIDARQKEVLKMIIKEKSQIYEWWWTPDPQIYRELTRINNQINILKPTLEG